MDLGLGGKTVLVTGGSKGSGRAVAEASAAEGARRLHLLAPFPAVAWTRSTRPAGAKPGTSKFSALST